MNSTGRRRLWSSSSEWRLRPLAAKACQANANERKPMAYGLVPGERIPKPRTSLRAKAKRPLLGGACSSTHLTT